MLQSLTDKPKAAASHRCWDSGCCRCRRSCHRRSRHRYHHCRHHRCRRSRLRRHRCRHSHHRRHCCRLCRLLAVSASVAHTAIANARLRYHHLRYHGHWTAVAAAAAIATPTTTAAAIAIDSIASAADSTAAAAITAAIAAASAVSALVAHAAIAMLSAATLTTTSRSAGSAGAAAAAATISPRRCTLYAAPTPTHLRVTFGHLYRPDLAYRPHCPPCDPTFSRLPRRLQLRSSRSRTSLWCGVQRAGARSTVVQFRCAAARPACLPPCHRMAATPKPLRCLHRNRR